MENLPNLQDFDPYWSRCPKSYLPSSLPLLLPQSITIRGPSLASSGSTILVISSSESATFEEEWSYQILKKCASKKVTMKQDEKPDKILGAENT